MLQEKEELRREKERLDLERQRMADDRQLERMNLYMYEGNGETPDRRHRDEKTS